MSESGDKKLLGNFRILIDECAADSGYNPKNNKLKVPALNTQHTAGDAAVDAVAASRAPNKLAVTARETAYAGMRKLVVRSHNFLKACGVARAIVEDASQIVRKLGSGGRKTKVAPAASAGGTTTPTPATVTRSTSQMSYDNQLGTLQSYLEVVRNIPEYDPNEADLKIAAMDVLADDLAAKNNAVSTTQATLDQARGTRDQLLYLADDSILNTARQVKSYVQAALGSDSQLYKKIKGIRFVSSQK
jgi:hypothetical protein